MIRTGAKGLERCIGRTDKGKTRCLYELLECESFAFPGVSVYE